MHPAIEQLIGPGEPTDRPRTITQSDHRHFARVALVAVSRMSWAGKMDCEDLAVHAWALADQMMFEQAARYGSPLRSVDVEPYEEE